MNAPSTNNINTVKTYKSFKDFYLDYQNNQIGAGQDVKNIRVNVDYDLSKNFMVRFYYEHMFSKAVISTMYPITNIRSGLSLRYNFGN